MYHWEAQRRGQSDIKNSFSEAHITWWRHQMETFSTLLAICAGNSPVIGEFPAQRPVTRSFDVLIDLCPNKRLNKRWWGWWFETPSCPLWRHCYGYIVWVYFHTCNSYVNYKFATYLSISVPPNFHPVDMYIVFFHNNNQLWKSLSSSVCCNMFAW